MKRLLILLGALAVNMAFAQDEGILNQLLAPGPLIKGHAELESKDCLKCHAVGKVVSGELCMKCHKEIRTFVENKRGFHGLTTKSCSECHADHQGRDFDSIAVSQKNFDHGALTGYKLEGKHAEIRCEKCHFEKHDSKSQEAGKLRYFGKQATCVSCHKKDDVHFFKGNWAKKDCAVCHGLKSWKQDLNFSHERDTKYKLEGKHAELKCADCHGRSKKVPTTIYKWPKLAQAQCLACHADFHQQKLSKRFRNGKCLECHTQAEWKIKTFDHSVTKYPLRGKHADIECIECHKQSTSIVKSDLKKYNFTGLKSNCLACHRDFHKFGALVMKGYGRLNQCMACHNESHWKQIHAFEHNKNTRYVIDGKHEDLKCAECHLPAKQHLVTGIYKWPHLEQKTCENCHLSPHLKTFSAKFLAKKCTECHVTSGWQDTGAQKSFDHSKTRFPLTDAHTSLSCKQCHGESKSKQVFRFKSPELKFCVDCHANIHRQQFAKTTKSDNCTACHDSKSFVTLLPFDHSKTRYPLEGAHGQVKCADCHRAGSQVLKLPPRDFNFKQYPDGKSIHPSQYHFVTVKREECLSCHKDYHQGQLDAHCLSCHTLDSWAKPHFDHNKQSTYLLRGKHEQAKCADCHKPISNQFGSYHDKKYPIVRYKPLTKFCADCHKDPHKGSFGRKCQECHSERDWKATTNFHKNFTLNGVHYTLSCNECHKDGRKLAGMSQECFICHAKDDVHSGTLPHCQECHRQQFWEVSNFKHSLTLFPLRGAHRTIECMDCHRNGTYKGLNSQCFSCHLQDALGATPSHTGFANVTSCTDCHHNQFRW